MRAIEVLTPVIAVIVVAALAGGAVAITKKPKSQIHQLQTELASANTEIDSLKADSQSGAVTALKSKVDSLNSTIASFKICVPQLEQHVNGKSINTNTQNGYLTGAHINNPTMISANRTKLLNG